MLVIPFSKSSMDNYSSEFIGRYKLVFWSVTIEEKRSQYRTGLNSEYRMDKWGFIAKEQGGGH